MKRLVINWADQSWMGANSGWRGMRGMVGLSSSQRTAQVSHRKGKGDDVSWWKWCKNWSPWGNTQLMWVTNRWKLYEKQCRWKGHDGDYTALQHRMVPSSGWRETHRRSNERCSGAAHLTKLSNKIQWKKLKKQWCGLKWKHTVAYNTIKDFHDPIIQLWHRHYE